MASNHTQHFALNQWAASDPVLRADFNADNAAIDSALQTLTNGQSAILLGTYSFAEGQQQLNINLTPFNISQFVGLELRLVRLSSNSDFNVRCRLNGITDKYTNSANGSRYLTDFLSFSSPSWSSAPYIVDGRVTMNLTGSAIVGKMENMTMASYSGVYYAYPNENDWGIHPQHLVPANFNTLNIISSAALTGGHIQLIAHRF